MQGMPHMYDVAIIGAGPAGATLARLIGNQYKVLLIERRRLPDASEDNYFKLTLAHGKRNFVEKTKILIGADGAKSKIRA